MNIPSLTTLEPGLSEPVLREAEAIAQAVPQLSAIVNLTPEQRYGLSRDVYAAHANIVHLTRAELAELEAAVGQYRDAVHAAVEERDLPATATIARLLPQIAELQGLQDSAVADEQRQRNKIEEERETRSLNKLRNSLSGEKQPAPRRRSFFRRAPSQEELDNRAYQALMAELQRTKASIADIVTTKKRFELQLEKAQYQQEKSVWLLPEVHEKRAVATQAFERAVDAVAHKGLIPIYSAWITAHPAEVPVPVAERDAIELDDPFLAEIAEDPSADFDVFISHASEDKDAVARPLTEALQHRDLKVWLDEHELTLGDSLSRKIDDGLARSRFGVVILSQAFFVKNWPQRELEGLVSRETIHGHKVILPVWHGVSQEDVFAKSPLLAGRLAVDTGKGIEAVADAIMGALRRPA